MKKETIMARVFKAIRDMLSRDKQIKAAEDRVTVAESKPRRHKKRRAAHHEPVGVHS
jgi:hypothetical protein